MTLDMVGSTPQRWIEYVASATYDEFSGVDVLDTLASMPKIMGAR